ncbi:nitrite reductase [Methylobacterium tarhaniae]
MNPAPRRGWCPGLARPMPTGDGLLVRLHPVAGRLTAAQVRAAARAAREGGNGLLDVTARGNLQIRGVTAESHGRVAAILGEAGLGDVRHDGGPQRLTLSAPLAGAHCLAVVAAVEAIGREVPGLPAKTLVAVDDDRGGLGPVEADFLIRVIPESSDADETRGIDAVLSSPLDQREQAPPTLQLALATPSGPLWLAPTPAPTALATLRTLLHGLAASGARRIRALPDSQRDALLADLPPGEPPPGGAPRPAGLHGRALLAELAFGRCDAALLESLAAWCETQGDGHLALTPSRGIALAARDHTVAATLRDAAAAAGLIVDPADPRRAVAACPGAPACASGGTPAQADAPRLATAFAHMAERGATAHVSGCPKGCASPSPAALTLVGRSDGLYGVVLDGNAGTPTDLVLTFGAVLERLESTRITATLDVPSGLRDAFREPA